VRTLGRRDRDFIFKPKRIAGSQTVERILGGGAVEDKRRLMEI
jgi:hypothetical protein